MIAKYPFLLPTITRGPSGIVSLLRSYPDITVVANAATATPL
jgi:hypothetical protein